MYLEKDVPIAFKIHEVAKILNCSRSQVYLLIKSKDLDSVQIRGSRRVTENQLVRFIKKIEGWLSIGGKAKLVDKKELQKPLKSGNKGKVPTIRSLTYPHYGRAWTYQDKNTYHQ